MKSNYHTANNNLFKTHPTVTAEEILAAGGATAFGTKTGKNSEGLKKTFKKAVKP